jgi:hypothetical protein
MEIALEITQAMLVSEIAIGLNAQLSAMSSGILVAGKEKSLEMHMIILIIPYYLELMTTVDHHLQPYTVRYN